MHGLHLSFWYHLTKMCNPVSIARWISFSLEIQWDLILQTHVQRIFLFEPTSTIKATYTSLCHGLYSQNWSPTTVSFDHCKIWWLDWVALLFSFQMSTSWISFLELKLISHSLEFALIETKKVCPPHSHETLTLYITLTLIPSIFTCPTYIKYTTHKVKASRQGNNGIHAHAHPTNSL